MLTNVAENCDVFEDAAHDVIVETIGKPHVWSNSRDVLHCHSCPECTAEPLEPLNL